LTSFFDFFDFAVHFPHDWRSFQRSIAGKPGIAVPALALRALLAVALVSLLALAGCPGTGSDTGPAFRSVSVARNGDALTVSWEAAPDAEGYRFYLAENREDTEDLLPQETADPVYIVAATNSGSVYYFWVRAVVNGVETDDWWARGSAAMPVAAPSNIVLSRALTSIYVYWDPVNGANSYEVYYSRINRSENAEKWTGAIEDNSTEIQNLTSNVSYYIWVRALGREGPSPFSDAKNAMTGPPKEPAVPAVSWTIRMKNAVGAIWSPAENATSYDFCYSMGNEPSGGTIVNVKDTICLVENLPWNVNYRVWVRGKNTRYVSDWTAVYEVKTGQGFPEHMEGTYFSRYPVDTHGGVPYYMDGYQIGKVRNMYRDFPFNKTKFTDPKYQVGLPPYMVNAGVTRDLPRGNPYDDDDQYLLHHFNGFMGIVRAVLERQPRSATGAFNYTFVEFFGTPDSRWTYTVVKFTYFQTSNSYLRGVNGGPLITESALTPERFKAIAAGRDWDQNVAYPGIRLGYTGSGKGVGGADVDADFHPELLPPNFFHLAGDLWDLVNW
jgi:hypothetical protein